MRIHAHTIWQAAVDAVRPEPLVRQALADLAAELRSARRIVVLGAGKAGAAMAAAVEAALADRLDAVEGIVNVPADAVMPLQKIRLHAARPAATNFPTSEGVAGAAAMLRLARSAGPDDIALCLISGGGSALLPAPADGISLDDKLAVTRLLHHAGATINEMNAVRKHLSAIKGGRLAQAFTGRAIYSLIISDVVGDPLDVIASGPTAADPSTFAEALAILERYQRFGPVPSSVWDHLKNGAAGRVLETPKTPPPRVHNLVLGNNARALAAAQRCAEKLGFRVLNLGSFIEGETRQAALVHAGIVRSIQTDGVPIAPPACILSGGETTVTLSTNPGRGGRNQEFALAALVKLGMTPGWTVLSGGTDGEDGPTDAAGAYADMGTLQRGGQLGLNAADCLNRNDAYSFFQQTGDLLITGLTGTNVMDVRVLLCQKPTQTEPRP